MFGNPPTAYFLIGFQLPPENTPPSAFFVAFVPTLTVLPPKNPFTDDQRLFNESFANPIPIVTAFLSPHESLKSFHNSLIFVALFVKNLTVFFSPHDSLKSFHNSLTLEPILRKNFAVLLSPHAVLKLLHKSFAFEPIFNKNCTVFDLPHEVLNFSQRSEAFEAIFVLNSATLFLTFFQSFLNPFHTSDALFFIFVPISRTLSFFLLQYLFTPDSQLEKPFFASLNEGSSKSVKGILNL